MRAVLKMPSKDPEIINVECDLEALQDIIGGSIEHVGFVQGIGILCDMDGRYKGPQVNGKPTSLPYNFFLPHYIGAFVGPVLLVGEGEDDFTDLDDEQISRIFSFFDVSG